MNNMLSYCGLVDAKIRASDKNLPVRCTSFEKVMTRKYLITSFFIVQQLMGSSDQTTNLVFTNSSRLKTGLVKKLKTVLVKKLKKSKPM